MKRKLQGGLWGDRLNKESEVSNLEAFNSPSLKAIKEIMIDRVDQKGMKAFWDVYQRHLPQLTEELLRVCKQVPELDALIRSTSEKEMQESQVRSEAFLKEALVMGNWEPLLQNLATQGETYAQMDLSFGSWFILTSSFRKIILPHIFETFSKDSAMALKTVDALDSYMDISLSVIGELYLRVKEKVISKQEKEILELSTPVLKLRDKLLLLPIVGVLDTQRAKQLTVQLLNMIREHRAKAIVIDITGVPAVDSKVAQHIIQTIAAAKLMGASSVITGLSPTIASTLVTLGIDLSIVRTVVDLEGGIEEALAILESKRIRTSM